MSDRDAATRSRGARAGSNGIRAVSRRLSAGGITPAQAIDQIIGWARVSQQPGTIGPWDQSSIWPIYAPFHSIASRWWQAQENGELTAELIALLEAETLEAARGLMPLDKDEPAPG